MGNLILITAGVRAGEGRYADQLARALGGDRMTDVATAEARDEEMQARIAARPATRDTIETPLDVVGEIAEGLPAPNPPRVFLVECPTRMVRNHLLLGDESIGRHPGRPESPRRDALRPRRSSSSPRNPIVNTRYSWLAGFVGAVVSCLGCDRAPAPPVAASPRPEPTPVAPIGWPLEVVDGFGRQVVIARPPRRIVALAPSNTELLFAVGAGDRAIARTTVCNYPPEAEALPVIGGMMPKGINLEAIVALRPDLVLATCGVQEPIIAPIERLGLPIVALDADDFVGVARNIRLVGRLTDHPTEGEQLADQFLGRIEAVRRRVATRTTPSPRVLYLVSEDPLMTAGPKTFISQMIEAAGGVNVFGDVTARYPKPSEEEILARAPDVVLTSMGSMNAGQTDEATRRVRIGSRPGWGQIPAVRSGRIFFLDEGPMSRPGPRLADAVEAVAAALEQKIRDP